MHRFATMSNRPPSLPSSPELRASWLRSHRHGLDPDQRLSDALLSRADLADRLEANARLVAFSRPAIENLYQQIGSPSSTVLLADNRGLILSALGNTDFLDRAARVALSPGAEWSEAKVGTNAIGTALHTGRIVAVRGGEHFLDRNRILTCVATPILAPRGGTLGILDVSTDARADISHAGALLRTTAELIEHSLIEHLDDGFLTVRFHTHHEMIGGPLEGVAVFGEDGALVASNRTARTLLELDRVNPKGDFDACFAAAWSSVVAAARADAAVPLRSRHGRGFIARASLRLRHASPRRPYDVPPARKAQLPPPAAAGADPRVAAALDAISRSVREPMLLEGETGTGKTHLVRAFHAEHGGRSGAPLVVVDAASLHVSEIDAELAHALARARDGLLLVLEVDALPADAQAALMRSAGTKGAPRIVAATRGPLAELAAAGRFDYDAFRDAGGRHARLPPLREREDFDALVRLFVREASPDRPIYVCPDAVARLRQYPWPGNLRELRNQLRLILALMGDDANQVCAEDIPPELFEDDATA